MALLRRLVGMDKEGRARELAKRAEKKRLVIEQTLKQLDALSPEEQRVRLRLMELRWELSRVIQNPPTNRAVALSFIPEEDRKLVMERLRYWDRLSHELQKSVLENEMMLSYFLSGQARGLSDLSNQLETLSPYERTNLTAALKGWRELTPDAQKKIYENFREVFGLDAKDREKVVERVASVGERQQIQRMIQSFEKLPPDQYQQCVDSLRKFTDMSMDERAQFLRNAERWRKMPEVDKERWRNLVRAVPPMPPLPPGIGSVLRRDLTTNQQLARP